MTEIPCCSSNYDDELSNRYKSGIHPQQANHMISPCTTRGIVPLNIFGLKPTGLDFSDRPQEYGASGPPHIKQYDSDHHDHWHDDDSLCAVDMVGRALQNRDGDPELVPVAADDQAEEANKAEDDYCDDAQSTFSPAIEFTSDDEHCNADGDTDEHYSDDATPDDECCETVDQEHEQEAEAKSEYE